MASGGKKCSLTLSALTTRSEQRLWPNTNINNNNILESAAEKILHIVSDRSLIIALLVTNSLFSCCWDLFDELTLAVSYANQKHCSCWCCGKHWQEVGNYWQTFGVCKLVKTLFGQKHLTLGSIVPLLMFKNKVVLSIVLYACIFCLLKVI